jgi:hypothetical protein
MFDWGMPTIRVEEGTLPRFGKEVRVKGKPQRAADISLGEQDRDRIPRQPEPHSD